MSGGWPSSIDPLQLADKGVRLTGEITLAAMPRLLQMCRRDGGSVNIDLHFERSDPNGLRVMHGTVRASMPVTCQRCLNEMTLELTVDPRLIVLRPGERDDLERDTEVLVVERPVSLSALVEDELLLAMPMIPMHAPASCAANIRPAGAGTEPSANPFSVLEQLKRGDR